MVDVVANVKFPDGGEFILKPVSEKRLDGTHSTNKNSIYLTIGYGTEEYDLTREAIYKNKEILLENGEERWILFSSLVTNAKIFLEFIPYIR